MTTVNITDTTISDGLTKTGPTWSGVRSAASAASMHGQNTLLMKIIAVPLSGGFGFYRGEFVFDTREYRGAILSSAKVKLYVTTKDDDTEILLLKGLTDHPSNPPVITDYNLAYWGAAVSTKNVSMCTLNAYNEWDITDLTAINVDGGYTKLYGISGMDYSNTPQGGGSIYGLEIDGPAGQNPPILELTFTYLPSSSVTLEFGGDGTNPPVFVKDSIQKDWKTKKDIIDNIFNAMLKDDQLTNKIRKYFYYQSNYGKPTFVIKPWPSTDSLPKVVWNFTGDEIINITRSRTKFTVDVVDGYWLNEGDVVYIDTSEEDIRGYYIIPELIYNVSKNSIITTLVLDYVTRYSST